MVMREWKKIAPLLKLAIKKQLQRASGKCVRLLSYEFPSELLHNTVNGWTQESYHKSMKCDRLVAWEKQPTSREVATWALAKQANRPGECSPEKDCLWWHWLTFRQPERKSSSESLWLWWWLPLGCRNVSQCHHKQSFSGLHSPGR